MTNENLKNNIFLQIIIERTIYFFSNAKSPALASPKISMAKENFKQNFDQGP